MEYPGYQSGWKNLQYADFYHQQPCPDHINQHTGDRCPGNISEYYTPDEPDSEREYGGLFTQACTRINLTVINVISGYPNIRHAEYSFHHDCTVRMVSGLSILMGILAPRTRQVYDNKSLPCCNGD